MRHISTTPFGRRPVTAGLLAAQALAQSESDCTAVDRWAVQRDLTDARLSLGLSDRDLAVLALLISFWRPEAIPGDAPAVVFPSNAAICARGHGMAESTLRRHLAALVAAGVVLRQDSPNGKRYAVRGLEGCAFGFDLSPLARRAPEFAALAEAQRNADASQRRQREAVVLRLRDCDKLLAHVLETVPGTHDALIAAQALLRRELRRKMDAALLTSLEARATDLLQRINNLLNAVQTEVMHGNAAQNERHKQYSTKTLIESEPCDRAARAADVTPGIDSAALVDIGEAPALPLHLVLRACPQIAAYAPDGLRDWRDLVAAAAFVRGMMGISHDAWDEALHEMGGVSAAVTVACMLESFDRIRKPGGYLRALSRKAAEGGFSTGPMLMALLRAENTRPA